MTLRSLAAILAVSCLMRWSRGQPPACELDRQCLSGFYCVPELFVCRRCLDCEDLTREPPRVATNCVKSVAECGPCVKGLVDEVHGDVAECVPGEGTGSFPVWARCALALGLALLVAGAALVYCMLRNNLFNVMSIKTLTSTSVSPSAPEQPPPPYYAVPYTDHRREDGHVNITEGDSSMTLMKPQRPANDSRGARGTRGTDGRQAATPYDNPDYVRLPPAEETVGHVDPGPPSLALHPAEPAHDEDTVPSFWTPDTHPHGDSGAGAHELSDLLSAARRSTILRDPRTCTQETNNNRTSEPSGAAGEGGVGGVGGAGVQAFFINIQQNMYPEARRSQVNDASTKLTL